jgi:hypothetical protein
VIELGKGLWFVAQVLGDLDRDQSLQRELPGQEHTRECAAAEFDEQVEVVEPLADLDLREMGARADDGRWSESPGAAFCLFAEKGRRLSAGQLGRVVGSRICHRNLVQVT